MNFFKYSFKIAALYNRLGLYKTWRGIRFLCYHSIYNQTPHIDSAILNYSISKNEFLDHLNLIDDLQIKVISMDEALYLLDQNQAQNRRYICFTFDDGYLDNYIVAWPILKQRGYSAHFFICSGLIGRKYNSLPLVGIDELRSIKNDGGTIGSHSHDHSILINKQIDDMIKQIKNSKRILEDITGGKISCIAYPNSQYNKRIIEITRYAGYQFAFSIGFGPIKNITRLNRYSLPRSAIYGNAQTENQYILEGCYDWSRIYFSIQNKFKIY